MYLVQLIERKDSVRKMSFIHKICEHLGENNKPIYTVMAIACGKGTVRPILSITDKKEKPDARKYAALRELLTEFIGVPTTLSMGLIAESLTGLVAKKGTVEFKHANAVLSFLGICAAAGYFVPKFCNLGMPPIMKKLMPNYDPNAGTNFAPEKPQATNSRPQQGPKKLNYYQGYTNTIAPYSRTGMRV